MIAALATTLSPLAQAQEGRSGQRALEGSWRVTVRQDPPPPNVPPVFEVLLTYANGGGVHDSHGSHGEWAHATGASFDTTLFKVIDQQGTLFQVTIREKVTMLNEDEYTSQDRVEIADANGFLVFAYDSTTHGRRIKVNPIP